MAKSKKALKALKRRKQAKERSRALKMRQDYTGGGRVKAQQGGFPSALPEGVRNAVEEARKAAEEQEREAKEAQQAQVQPTPTPPVQPQPRNLLRREPAVLEQRNISPPPRVIDTAIAGEQQPIAPGTLGRLTNFDPDKLEAVTPTAPTQPITPTRQEPVIVSDPRQEFVPEQPIQQQPVVAADTPQFGTRYDGKPYTANDYNLIKGQGGDPNNDGVITDEEWTNWMLGKGATPGFEEDYNRKLLEVASQGDLKRSTIEAINTKLGIESKPTPTPTKVAATTGTPNFDGSYEDFAGPIPQPSDFGSTVSFRGKPRFSNDGARVAYESAVAEWESQQALWNSLDSQARLAQFGQAFTEQQSDTSTSTAAMGTEEDPRKLPYKIPGLSREEATVEKADIATVSTEDDPKTEEDERTKSEAFQVERFKRDEDGNIIFNEDGTPQRDPTTIRQVDRLVTEDDPTTPDVDERAVGVEDITEDTVTSTERQLTDPAKVKTNAELLGVEEKAIRGFLAAESNYFNKYPEVRDAIKRGEATDIFDYQRRIGEGKGYTLDFEPTEYAAGTVERLAEASEAELTRTRAAERDAQQEREALARQPEFIEDTRSQIDPVTGERVVLSATREAEKQSRQAILDETAAQGTEALIQGTVGYEAAERRELKGEAAKGDARSLLQEVGEIPPEISEAILENPAQVTAQVDTEPVEVQAAIAALPNEALVSVQLENLLAGIDEGVTPTWARPAVQLVESRLNARGLNVSTVGRDALFNAIIQTALPIAQSNAAALQQRANQNLSNEQQANLQQSSQEMQLRLNNLANRQASGSQSAQLAQQINLTQGQFTQQAQLTESEQAQQVRLQSLQNEQQAAMANLGNDQQIELANLQIEAQRLGANQSAINQERLAEMQVAANFLEKNAAFKQQMEVANLSSEQQMRLAFLTAKNQAEAQNLTAAQQTELANLNSRLEVNRLSASLAQQMNLAQLNVDQQTAVRNAATVANIDLTKFTAEQQVELTNSKFMQTSTLQDLNNRQQTILRDATSLAAMDLAQADSLTKVSIENARNFLSMNMSNLNSEQQAYMLDSQQRQQRMLSDVSVENAARQFNSSSNLQTQQFVTSLAANLAQFNSQQVNALEQFNSSETNRVAAINAGNELQAEQILAQINTQISQFNSQQDLQVEQFNTANAQAVEQSNIEWRRKVNLADTAATNAANQQQAAFQFDMNKTALSQAWQSLRDQANFDFQEYQTNQERKISAINAILGNEAFMTQDKFNQKRDSFFNMLNTFSMSIKDFRDIGFVELADEIATETTEGEG